MLCKNCGKYNYENSKQCSSCGIKFHSDKYRVVISNAEIENLDVVRTVAEITKLTPVEVKMLLENFPANVAETDTIDEAVAIKSKLKAVGIICVEISSVEEKTSNCGKASQNYNDSREYPGNNSKKNTEPIYEDSKNSEKKSPLKTIWGFMKFIALVVVACIFFCNPLTAGTDLLAFLNGNDYIDNPYLEMVQNHRPFNNGDTYYGAFANTFDENKWTYFKDNGDRIVQVQSYHNDLTTEVITQFLITPDEEKEAFLIEPYAMKISGQLLSEYEMNIVLSAMFSGELIETLGGILGRLFIYGVMLN